MLSHKHGGRHKAIAAVDIGALLVKEFLRVTVCAHVGRRDLAVARVIPARGGSRVVMLPVLPVFFFSSSFLFTVVLLVMVGIQVLAAKKKKKKIGVILQKAAGDTAVFCPEIKVKVQGGGRWIILDLW